MLQEKKTVTSDVIYKFSCEDCKRTFRTEKGLKQLGKSCKHKKHSPIEPEPQCIEAFRYAEDIKYKWGSFDDKMFEKTLSDVYEKTVYWRKNLFLLPTGTAGKRYIDEITRLMNDWLDNTALKNISFKAIMVMPNLLLQKPSKNSKAKDHLKALERRLQLWYAGNLSELFLESQTIQDNLKSFNKPKSVAESKKFAAEMQKGNVNGAIKLLTNKMQHGILPLNENTLSNLRMKHPTAQKAGRDVLLPDEPSIVHQIRYKCIDAEAVRKAAIRTKGGSGPSGIDADGWRRILASNNFGESSDSLCETFSKVIRKLCSSKEDSASLEAFLACRLIPLDKNPGLRPIGVGESRAKVLYLLYAMISFHRLDRCRHVLDMTQAVKLRFMQ